MVLKGICPKTGNNAGITFNHLSYECTQCNKTLGGNNTRYTKIQEDFRNHVTEVIVDT